MKCTSSLKLKLKFPLELKDLSSELSLMIWDALSSTSIGPLNFLKSAFVTNPDVRRFCDKTKKERENPSCSTFASTFYKLSQNGSANHVAVLWFKAGNKDKPR